MKQQTAKQHVIEVRFAIYKKFRIFFHSDGRYSKPGRPRHQRRLPGAGATDQANALSRVDAKRHPTQHLTKTA